MQQAATADCRTVALVGDVSGSLGAAVVGVVRRIRADQPLRRAAFNRQAVRIEFRLLCSTLLQYAWSAVHGGCLAFRLVPGCRPVTKPVPVVDGTEMGGGRAKVPRMSRRREAHGLSARALVPQQFHRSVCNQSWTRLFGRVPNVRNSAFALRPYFGICYHPSACVCGTRE